MDDARNKSCLNGNTENVTEPTETPSEVSTANASVLEPISHITAISDFSAADISNNSQTSLLSLDSDKASLQKSGADSNETIDVDNLSGSKLEEKERIQRTGLHCSEAAAVATSSITYDACNNPEDIIDFVSKTLAQDHDSSLSKSVDSDIASGKDLEKCTIGDSEKTSLFDKRRKINKILRSKKRQSDDSDSSTKDTCSSGDQNESQPAEPKKQKRVESGDMKTFDDLCTYEDAKDTIDEATKTVKKQHFPLSPSSSSSSSDSDDDSISLDSDESKEDDKEKREKEKLLEETWLKKDILGLSSPRWKSIIELRKRQTASRSEYWPVNVCGSRAMVQRFKLEAELKKHNGCVNALHFNQRGTILASGSDDLKVMLWDWVHNKRDPVVTYDSGHKSNVFQAKFLPDCGDATVVSSARDGQVRVADISTTGSCRGTKKVAQHRGSAHKLALEVGTRSSFLSCGEDGTVFGIDLRNDKPAEKLVLVKVNNRKIPLYSIHANPCRPYEFAVSGRDENARVFDRRMLLGEEATEPVKVYCPHHIKAASDVNANITCLVYNWDGSELLCSYNDEDIYLFDTSHSSEADYIKRYKGHRNNATVKGVNFYGPRSEFVVSGSDCGNVFFWDKESSRVVTLVEGDQGGVVNVLEPHPSLPVMATSGLDHEVKIWTPTADPLEHSKLDELKTVMLLNRREREDERTSMPDMIDGHMLWFLMRTLRSRNRRRADQRGDSSSDDDSDSSNSSDDTSGEEGQSPQCAQS